ncbi:MAG: T9SS type A sorting domain-containing protein, partial [Bacteroidota bacterium]
MFTHTYDSAGTYVVHLTLTDSAGCSVMIEQTIKIGFKVGIKEGLGFRGFKLYPNPNLGNFWVDYEPMNQEILLEITNPIGQLILTKTFKHEASLHERIELPQGSANGVYTVRILDGELQVLGRVFYND